MVERSWVGSLHKALDLNWLCTWVDFNVTVCLYIGAYWCTHG